MVMLSFLLSALSTLFFATPDDVQVRVQDEHGNPVTNAVVMLPQETAQSTPIKFEWPNVMEQKDLQFHPYVLVVPVGSEVEFPNRDRVRHHVYSFSKGNRFQLKLYGKEESRSVTFEKAGNVAVGCNIHDGMIGFIRVVDTPYAAKTDETGMAVLKGVTDAETQIHVWHPEAKPRKDIVVDRQDADTPQVITLPIKKSRHSAGHH
jgi:plastocyanin